MASWTLAPCLEELILEFHRTWPGRDTESDGTIGDEAHAATKSDHNPDARRIVHAVDIDAGLAAGDPDAMERTVQRILARCRAGLERRLTYIIYKRRIWSRSRGWVQRPYTGLNAHKRHAHFSADDTPALERDRRPYLLEAPMTAPTADQNAAATTARDIDPTSGTYSLGGAVWTTLQRTAGIGPLATTVNALNVRVQDQNDELDELGASLVLLSNIVESVTIDPAVPADGANYFYDAARAAVRDELDARGLTGPA